MKLSGLPLAALLLLLSLFARVSLAAAPAQGGEVRLEAFKVVTRTGPNGARESVEPLQAVRPGDTVEYVATYTNGLAGVAHGVQLMVPVPAGGLEYVAQQAAPLADAVSLDGKSFAPLPLTRKVTEAGGKTSVKPVPLGEYRSLRWTLGDVPAGASRSVRARMVLPSIPSSAVASVNASTAK